MSDDLKSKARRMEAEDEQTLRRTGERVKLCREKAGFTQITLAENSGVGQGVISRLEKGQRAPLFIHFHKIAKALNVSESVLIDGED
jgi:transcriptional regulator with XRE-family HTH domain